MYRHLNHKYGMQIADHTPTLSFDFSGPLPIAVTGAKILNGFRLAITRYSVYYGHLLWYIEPKKMYYPVCSQ